MASNPGQLAGAAAGLSELRDRLLGAVHGGDVGSDRRANRTQREHHESSRHSVVPPAFQFGHILAQIAEVEDLRLTKEDFHRRRYHAGPDSRQ